MERKSSRRSYGRSNSRTGKTWQRKCKDYFREFIAFMFTNIGIIGLVVGYTIIGAFVFIAIEGPQSQTLSKEVSKRRNMTTDYLWEVTHDMNMFNETTWRNHVSVALLDYQREFVESVKNGYDPKHVEQWSFSGAFLYSLTVITTIGYGNVAPSTEWGKLTTILYAIVGMPLFLLYLSNIGDILAKSFKWIYSKLCLCQICPKSFKRRRRRRKRREMNQEIDLSYVGGDRNWQAQQTEEDGRQGPNRRIDSDGSDSDDDDSDDEDSDDDDEDDDHNPSEGDEDEDGYDPQTVTVPLTLCLSIMVGYVCGGALLFSRWEDWDFLDGSYFCFISLSTIGFGDIVPGDEIYKSEAIEISFILTAVYLMLGMALIAMCFNLMQEEVIHKVRTYIRTCRSVFTCCGKKNKQVAR